MTEEKVLCRCISERVSPVVRVLVLHSWQSIHSSIISRVTFGVCSLRLTTVNRCFSLPV